MWCKGCTPTLVGGKSSILFVGSIMQGILTFLALVLIFGGLMFSQHESTKSGEDTPATGETCVSFLVGLGVALAGFILLMVFS